MEKAERDAQLEAILVGLTDKEKMFVLNYCRYMSKTRAAIAAGYSEHTAGEIGYQVYNKDRIYNAIQAYLKFTRLSPEDNINLIKRTAEVNMADYFHDVKSWELVRTAVPLRKIINDHLLFIDVETDYVMDSPEMDPVEKSLSIHAITQARKKIKKYEAELFRNPKATRFEMVDTIVVKRELNINKVVDDRVPIKSVKYTKDGIQIETYSAKDAQDTLAKIDGSFELDNAQRRPVINNNLSSERVKEIADKLEDDV